MVLFIIFLFRGFSILTKHAVGNFDCSFKRALVGVTCWACLQFQFLQTVPFWNRYNPGDNKSHESAGFLLLPAAFAQRLFNFHCNSWPNRNFGAHIASDFRCLICRQQVIKWKWSIWSVCLEHCGDNERPLVSSKYRQIWESVEATMPIRNAGLKWKTVLTGNYRISASCVRLLPFFLL